MKKYFKSGVYSTPKEKHEAKMLNIYANLYAQYVDDNEDHVYQHIVDNLLDVASVSELEKHISKLRKHIRSTIKGENHEL